MFACRSLRLGRKLIKNEERGAAVGQTRHPMKFKYPSPADIEEMKARGYERETIDRALEQSKRWHEAESIRASIRNAFAGMKLGNGVGLYQAQGIDGYEDAEACATYRANDEKEDWSRISVKALNECNSSLSFFDGEGMRFHLPAYLLGDLNGTYEHGMAFVLTQTSQQEAQFRLLNNEQREAVRDYLKFIESEPEYAFDRESIRNALSTYGSCR